MRTTIEMTDAQRAKLLELAAERGEKGFSRLVQEAIEQYLARNEARKEQVRAARAVLGTFSDEEASALDELVQSTRASWR
jgi:metal-responsive CopG/Arc/MetJ family transcriptional regulator